MLQEDLSPTDAPVMVPDGRSDGRSDGHLDGRSDAQENVVNLAARKLPGSETAEALVTETIAGMLAVLAALENTGSGDLHALRCATGFGLQSLRGLLVGLLEDGLVRVDEQPAGEIGSEVVALTEGGRRALAASRLPTAAGPRQSPQGPEPHREPHRDWGQG